MRAIKLIFWAVWLPFWVHSQDISITIGKNIIALNEYFTITLSIKNGNITSYSTFPEIPNFTKKGISSSSMTNIVNGRMSQTFSLVQNYAPIKEGKFVLKPFSMEVNGVKISNNGTNITVTQPVQTQRNPFDAYEDFFWGGNSSNRTPLDYVDVKEDAFFALEVDKKSVYVGEGFSLSLSLYVSMNNKAEMEFVRLSEQIQELGKKLKCKSCFEENMFINQISPESVKIGNVNYTRYKFYETVLFPFNNDPIGFPTLSLELIKYKISKQRSFFGHEKQADKLVLYSKPVVVKVKNLPEHPLKDFVSVGDFRIEETISKNKIKVGEGVNYRFSIYGMGNIAGAEKPRFYDEKKADENIEFFEPSVTQKLTKGNGTVSGKKTWDYYVVPNHGGKYDMKDYFYWVYFSTKLNRYDTLKSSKVFEAIGESLKNAKIESAIGDDFYRFIGQSNSEVFNQQEKQNSKFLINIILCGILGLSFGLIIYKTTQQRRKPKN
ncbi:MAG: BatD family protein [Cytophagales bacterium]